MAKSVVRDESLDGLRGFAAIYVVLFHVAPAHPDFKNYSEIFKSIFLSGACMVAVFFVLSGYFISDSITKLSKNQKNGHGNFILRRFFRIMPLWTVLLIYLFTSGQIGMDVLFANMVFYFGNLEFINNKWLPVVEAWTLHSEIIFYVLASIFFKQIANLKTNATLMLWLISFFISSLWRFISVEYFRFGNEFTNHLFLSQAHYFIAGIFIHKAIRIKSYLDVGLARATIWSLEALIFWSLLMSFHKNFFLIDIRLLAPAIVFIVTLKESFLRRILKSKILAQLGAASFGIYILQGQVLGVCVQFGFELNFLAHVLIRLVSCIVVGLIAYHLVERPFIHMSKNSNMKS